jgi:hypothetical protein
MSVGLKERNIGTLILIAFVGILIGSYLNALVGMLPGGGNVVKTFFTASINFGVGYPNAIFIDLDAIKFQLGFQMKFSILSIIGMFLGFYLFRWFK